MNTDIDKLSVKIGCGQLEIMLEGIIEINLRVPVSQLATNHRFSNLFIQQCILKLRISLDRIANNIFESSILQQTIVSALLSGNKTGK